MSISASLDASSASRPPFAATPLILALGGFALCAFSLAVLNDGDTWSHIGTGEWILNNRAIPHADPFSFTFAGRPWVAHEWLSEILMALAYRAAGFPGVMLLTGAAAAVSAYVVAKQVVDRLPGVAGPALALLALALTTPGLLARPHVLALPVFAIWTAALFQARENARAPALGYAALMCLWANLHGGFAFGLALIAPFALEAVWEAAPGKRIPALRDWGLFAALSVIAALLTPFGVEGLLFPIKLIGQPLLANIGEWRAEDFSHPGPLEIFLLGLVAFALIRPMRLAPIRVALLVGLIHLALQHARHEMLLAVVAPMILARPMSAALPATTAQPPMARKWLAAGFGVAVLLAGVRIAFPLPQLDTSSAPSRAFATVPDEIRGKPVLNSYSFGGFLIFAKVRPFIDGRADMYGPKFLSTYARLASGDEALLTETLKTNEIVWTLFAPSQGVVAILDRLPGWRRLYGDAHAVVHVRDDAGLRRE